MVEKVLKIAGNRNKYALSENSRNFTHSNFRKRLIKFNYLHPSEIVFYSWMPENEPDEIIFRSHSGGIYSITDENLLNDISMYMKSNGQHGNLPFIHIDGYVNAKCYEQPCEHHIISYLKKYFEYYDIYDSEGEIVKSHTKKPRNYVITEEND